MLHNATLPPKRGYVEVEKTDGTRTYKNAATGVLIDDEAPAVTPDADQDAMLVDLEYRVILLELGVTI